MNDWADRVIEYERRKDAFLLEWREEIRAVEAYSKVPVHPWDAVSIAPEYVIPRLGAELTAMARAVRRLQQRAQGTAHRLRDQPDHPDAHHGADQAWGAQQAFAVGLGVHLDLTKEHADWLAEGLSGYVSYVAEHRDLLKSWQTEDGKYPKQ